MKARLTGILIGAIIGALLGAGTGIAGAFGGISGFWVFTVLGGIIGFFAVPDVVKFGQRLGRLVKW